MVAAVMDMDLAGLKQLIISEGRASVDVLDKHGQTVLMVAAHLGLVDFVVVLADNGANLDLAREDGTTPVYLAACNGHHEVVRVLADKGASLDLAPEDGWTPVLRAAQQGHHEVVRLLANKGANLGLATKKRGATPVYMAAHQGHYEVVRVLADKGANLELAGRKGRTPLSVAVRKGHHEIASFLVAWLSHQHCLIRLRVGATYATLPVGHEERVLYHFAYGKTKVNTPVAAEDEMLPRNLLPDDLWPLVVRCLVGDGNGTALPVPVAGGETGGAG